MKPRALHIVSISLIVLTIATSVGLAAWVWKKTNAVVADQGLLMLDQRTVENVECTGEGCGSVKLASDQNPGQIFFLGMNAQTRECLPITLWANQIREGQIGVNGYIFVEGGQRNLRPITVDESAIGGDPVEMPIVFTASTRATLSIRLQDTGDWNLVESVTVDDAVAEGFVVTSDYESGSKELLNTCGEAGKDTATYVIYQAPELAGPGDPLTYLVRVTRRGAYGGSDSNDVTVFEKNYSEEEMTPDAVRVDVTDGETTFGFDLVK